MPASFLPNKPQTGKTTIRFEWSADTQKLSDIANRISENLHGRNLGPMRKNPETEEQEQVPFDELSNQQRLKIVYNYISDTMQGLARQQRLDEAQETARDGVLTTPEEDKFE